MSRLPRGDGPNTWHHVMNRGVARRTVFENDGDVRYFLSRLARAVRAGWIEVHAYCLLTTHFHLLLRSPEGALSEAMRVVQNDYVRWFNRRRRRDGALFRGRFRSKPVDSRAYLEQLVRYIDFNPVGARLVAYPALYPHGSAHWYALPRRPPWLERAWVEARVCAVTRTARYEPARYSDCFGGPMTPGQVRAVERRIEHRVRAPDPLDDLLGAAPSGVLEWMRRKASLADGTSIGVPVCDVESLSALVASERAGRGAWSIALTRKTVDAWQLIEVALLRELAAASWQEVGDHVALTDAGAAQCYRRHARALEVDPCYAEVVARLARASIQACYGPSHADQPVGEFGGEGHAVATEPCRATG